MKTNTLVAVILIALGIVVFSYYGITYTTKEKVVDLGPIQVTAEETHKVPVLPILAGIGLAVGTVLLLANNKKVLA